MDGLSATIESLRGLIADIGSGMAVVLVGMMVTGLYIWKTWNQEPRPTRAIPPPLVCKWGDLHEAEQRNIADRIERIEQAVEVLKDRTPR